MALRRQGEFIKRTFYLPKEIIMLIDDVYAAYLVQRTPLTRSEIVAQALRAAYGPENQELN